MNKKIAIIGGGISGLSAGCYLQMNGFETEIFEMHYLPGGLCTSWERKGFTIDNCISWLVGSSPSDKFYEIWNELINMQNIRFFDDEIYIRVEDQSGKSITVFRDVNRMEAEFLKEAPEDDQLIRKFSKAIRNLTKLNLSNEKAFETSNLLDRIKFLARILPHLGVFNTYMKVSLNDLSAKCKNPLLAKVFKSLFVPEMSALFMVFGLSWMNKKSAGYPIGGSLAFARKIEKRYLELGGKMRYQTKVIKISTNEIGGNSLAEGLTLENGELVSADIIISAADSYSTTYNLLGGRFADKKVNAVFENYRPFPSLLTISFGYNGKINTPAYNIIAPFNSPLRIGRTEEIPDCQIRIHDFDPTLAPPNKTLISAILPVYDFQFWEDLKFQNPEEYRSEKNRVAISVLDLITKKFGILKEDFEFHDVATPSTLIRYTGNWKGSFEGWIMSPSNGLKQLPKTLPGLKNFFQIGQWVEPGGGLPACLLSGRNVAQIICKQENQKFIKRVIRQDN
jgi:phytoene dehydrogenase-like protein